MGRDLLHITHLCQKHIPEPGRRWQLCKGSREVDALPGVQRDGRRDPLPPTAYLRYCDAAFLCQLFFGFFTGVGVTEVRVKILIQDFCGLFTEVTPFPSEMRKENHSCSSRCKQVSGRVSWGGSDPHFTCPCCSTQQHGRTILVPRPLQGSSPLGLGSALMPRRAGSRLQHPHSYIQPCKGLDSASGFMPSTSTWDFNPWVHRPSCVLWQRM